MTFISYLIQFCRDFLKEWFDILQQLVYICTTIIVISVVSLSIIDGRIYNEFARVFEDQFPIFFLIITAMLYKVYEQYQKKIKRGVQSQDYDESESEYVRQYIYEITPTKRFKSEGRMRGMCREIMSILGIHDSDEKKLIKETLKSKARVNNTYIRRSLFKDYDEIQQIITTPEKQRKQY
ncbi:UNKNOWN [Stylonychia lemnae]|uniref:Uncharacterized protein n=1 Tax=Stylonychia lemnae TaxID=5949 RepID=A0A078ARU1_STYLE|nr:UNKNOWN [Stylonychia lemnae]|eukprot:CDW84706.1 UNKNOWN [Stylonychia lemnae]